MKKKKTEKIIIGPGLLFEIREYYTIHSSKVFTFKIHEYKNRFI